MQKWPKTGKKNENILTTEFVIQSRWYGEISEQVLQVWLFWFLDFLTPSCFCSQEASRYEPKKLSFTSPLSDPDLHLAVYVSLQVEYLMTKVRCLQTCLLKHFSFLLSVRTFMCKNMVVFKEKIKLFDWPPLWWTLTLGARLLGIGANVCLKIDFSSLHVRTSQKQQQTINFCPL